jgi:hypothetical protein
MKKARKSNAKRKSKAKKPKPDASQSALAAVEKIIGGKLAQETRKHLDRR